jgi:3-hydroxyacyl-[acyl-carrier-protein] dehydratase
MRWIFVDRFLELEKGRYAKALKNVSMGEDHIHDHFPSFPVMPNSLIIEALAQTGGVLAGYSNDFRNMVILAKIEKASFHRMATPGDQLLLETEMLEDREEGCRVAGRVSVNGDTVAEASILFANLDSSDIDPEAPDNFVFTKQFLSMLGVDKVLAGVGVPE